MDLIVQSIHLQMDNIATLSYLVKMEGYSQRSSLRHQQRNLGLLTDQVDHNYGRISSTYSQQKGQFSVASSNRLEREEIGSSSFSDNI